MFTFRGRTEGKGEREFQESSKLNPTWASISQLWDCDLSQNQESDAYLIYQPGTPKKKKKLWGGLVGAGV